jgi:glucan phosphoethanolaminetransferase (alkaline phosphatase superfamily)
MKTNSKIAYYLTAIIIALAAVVSAAGLLMTDLYLHSETIKTAWRVNDLITLVVVVPLLIISLFYSKKGSEGGYLCWM